MATDLEIFKNSVRNALRSGPKILVLDRDENASVAMCLRRRGEIIDDPECEQSFEALQGGVFFRAVRMRGDERSFTWLYACDLDDESIAEYLDHSFSGLSDLELAGMAVQAVFQAAKHNDPSLGRRPGI